MDTLTLKEAEKKLDEFRMLWLKSSSKEIRKMGKYQYNKLFPKVEKMRSEFWKETIKTRL